LVGWTHRDAGALGAWLLGAPPLAAAPPKLAQLLAPGLAEALASAAAASGGGGQGPGGPGGPGAVLAPALRLPRLRGLAWSVGVTAGSSHLSKMAVPTCSVRLELDDAGRPGELRAAEFELSRERLQVMIDGLTKIRDQLAGIQ
jgi:hypothetical protein